VQSLPQDPQFVLSLLMFVSQPSRTTSSSALQLDQPESQLMLHWAPMQLGVPWLLLQASPHPPQLEGLALTLVSQPSRVAFSLALQSSNPTLQAMSQTPSVQVGVPLAVLQGLVQAPQLSSSSLRLISQPLARLPSQLAKPTRQVYWQTPSEQTVGCMLAGAMSAQLMPHPPQLVSEVLLSVSQPSVAARLRSPLQSLHPESQVCSQAPVLHTGAE